MIDPFKAPGEDQLREMSGAKPSASDSVLVKGNRGGIGGGARKVLEDRKAAEAEPEPLDMESAEPEAEAPMDVEALLTFGAWSKPDTCFHEEAEVTVHLSLPKGKEHLTRIEAELHAEMESGLKLISKGESHAQADGTAVFILPVYKPDDYQSGIVKYALMFRHKLAKVLSPDDLFRLVSKTALKSADHALIPGIAFSKDSSFIGPKAATGLKLLETKFQEWEKQYPKKTKIVVYGHSNPDEKDPKALSERRAQSAFAFITNDADAWEKLYSIEKWGLVVFQVLLQELGHYVGKPDGADGPKTQTAFKAFQKQACLPETGKADVATRKALFSAYMKGKHDIKIDASRFRKVAGNPWMGCGHHNRAKADSSPAPENRRVAFILSNESKFFPPNFPCQDGNESPCQRQCKRDGKRSSSGIKCLFYDELVRENKQEANSEDDPLPQNEPPWMPIAHGEMGVEENKDKKVHNPRILEYHKSTWLKAETDEDAWCAAFVNWTLEKAGVTSKDSPRAKDWLDWGRPVADPIYGSVVVVKIKSYHVGFVVGKKGDAILILGGNQGGGKKVCVSEFKKNTVQGYRLPTEYSGAEIIAQEKDGAFVKDNADTTR